VFHLFLLHLLLFCLIILTFALPSPSSFLTICTISHKQARNSIWLSWVFTFTRFLAEVQWASFSRCIQGVFKFVSRIVDAIADDTLPVAVADYKPRTVDYRLRCLLSRRSWLNSNFLHSTSRALRLRYQLRWRRKCGKQILLTSKRFTFWTSIDITCWCSIWWLIFISSIDVIHKSISGRLISNHFIFPYRYQLFFFIF